MSYWNKSLKRDLLTNRTNTLLADLTSEADKLSDADTAFINLEYQALSNSLSISVIQSIAAKYRTVVDGFMTAADYDMVDCNKLLGYISAEEEDLIFGELYGQWQVAKEKKEKAESDLNNYQRKYSGTVDTITNVVGVLTLCPELIFADENVISRYELLIASYQREMDVYQKKLDRLGEFEDRSSKLFANSVDFRTNAVNALSDLKNCVSSDGTFKDLSYSSALSNLDKLHEQKQKEYYNQWHDSSGNIDMDAVEKFLFQDPNSVSMDQYLAFCKLMDEMSDEQMTDMMNRASRVINDYEINYERPSYIEVSQVLKEAADLNSTIWCAKYALNGYNRSGFDEAAMKRAIAIKYSAYQLEEMADRESSYIDPNGGIYKHLAVYVDGSNVYILPRIFDSDAYAAAYYAGKSGREEGVEAIFKKIIAGDMTNLNTSYLQWTVIGVDNNSDRDYAIDIAVKDIMNQLGGGQDASTYTKDKVKEKIHDHMTQKALEKLAETYPGVAAFSFGMDLIKFYAELQEEYLKISKNQNGQANLDKDIFYSAFFINNATFITYGGPGYGNPMAFENVQYETGRLRIALAAYNKYNDGLDIDINWIYNYDKCTEAQQEAVAKYVLWFHRAQNGNGDNPGTIKGYDKEFYNAYERMQADGKIKNPPSMYDLTPAQFREVQRFMEDPNCDINYDLWK